MRALFALSLSVTEANGLACSRHLTWISSNVPSVFQNIPTLASRAGNLHQAVPDLPDVDRAFVAVWSRRWDQWFSLARRVVSVAPAATVGARCSYCAPRETVQFMEIPESEQDKPQRN